MRISAANDDFSTEYKDAGRERTEQEYYDIVLSQPIIESFARFLVPELRKHTTQVTEEIASRGVNLPQKSNIALLADKLQ